MSVNDRGSLRDLSMEEFIKSPLTAAVMVRKNDLQNPLLTDNPDIRLGRLIDGSYQVCYVRTDLMPSVLRDIRICFPCLALGLMSRVDLESGGISAVQSQPYLSLSGDGILIGIIDTGIDFANKAFILEDGKTSKIDSIWDQSLSGSPPEGFDYGYTFSNEEISKAIESGDPYGEIAHRDEVGHGTFLAATAASHEPGLYVGVAPNAGIVAVKLKGASPFYRERYLIPDSQENVYETADLMEGIDYCLQRSYATGKPIAICIGLGTNLGGHDGFDILEDYLTSISYLNGVAICAAAGNEANAKHHAMGALVEQGTTAEVSVRVGENISALYLNMWNSPADRMSVSLRTPIVEEISRVPARSGETTTTRLIMENAIVSVSYNFPSGGSGSQQTEIRIDKPTPGIWKLYVYGEIVLEGIFHLWMNSTGMSDKDVEFLSPNPEFTVTVPGTAVGVITCGAYNSTNNGLYLASSWGPSRMQSITPDLAAPGVDVGGIFPDGNRTMSGTSVATAFVTGACALLLQWGLVNGNVASMNTYHIKSLLIQGCERDSGVAYPNDQWGYGRLNLYNTFLQMRSL
ncbi:MAG: S8 family peptidase [Clostridiales bacterium]|nr:S8 family peptidase [Clostridiales bacterium]